MTRHRHQYQARISPRQSTPESKTPRFTLPPIVQPKLQKKTPTELPEWQPGKSRAPHILQRLRDSPALQTQSAISQPQDLSHPPTDAVALAHRVLGQIISPAPATQRDHNTNTVQPSSHHTVIQRTLERVEAKLKSGKTLGGLEAFARTVEFSPENIGFLRACRVWRGLGRGANIAAQTSIYNKFITKINIPSAVRAELNNRHQASVAAGVPDVTIFDVAEREIADLIISNVLPRYNAQAEDTVLG